MLCHNYVTYKQIEEILESGYRNQRPMTVFALYDALKDQASQNPLPEPPTDPDWGSLNDRDFQDRMDLLPILLHPPVVDVHADNGPVLRESSAFAIRPDPFQLLIHRQYNYLVEDMHAHDYVEVYFIMRGTCLARLQDSVVRLSSGDMLFLAPGAKHLLESFEKDNFILDMSVRVSSFEDLFLKQLTYDSILSAFFRKILYDQGTLKYVLFHTGEDPLIRQAIKNVAMETSARGVYNEIVYTSWVNIIFSVLLRKYYEDVETNPPLESNDFAHILAYISDNYETVSLSELSSRFNYSKPHICNLIRRNTGHTLTDLINAQKLAKARILLETTDISIEEIAGMIGLTSSDYFTRLFRRTCGVTPGTYRRSQRKGMA